jgi:proteasome activator subunit 4
MMRYPIPKEKRIKLAKVYFHVATIPGMPIGIVALCADTLTMLIKSKKILSIRDMRLPWRPVYDILCQDLFLRRRQFEYTYAQNVTFFIAFIWSHLHHSSQLTESMGNIASCSRRFFHPAAIDEMLSTFVPLIDGTSLDVRSPLPFLIAMVPDITLLYAEYTLVAILPFDVSSHHASTILSTHVIPSMGVHQLLYV